MVRTADDFQKWSSQIRKGSLEMCVLAAVAGRARYGFEIQQALSGTGELGIKEGTLYPLLNRLQAEGLVEASWRESTSGPPRKYYLTTAKGRADLTRMSEEWRRYARAVERALTLVSEEEQGAPGPALSVAPPEGS